MRLDAVQRLWGKRRDMTVRGRLPFNAEPPASVFGGAEIAALGAIYCRNNGPFPDVAPEQWRLTVDFAPQITAAPLVGEHTDDVLAELGYDAETIAKMHARQIV